MTLLTPDATTSPSTSEFILSPCTLEDVPEMVSVYREAFASNEFAILSFPGSIPDSEMQRWLTSRFSSIFAKREVKMFKVVHQGSGQMAAFLRWTFPTVLTDEEKAEREEERLFREEEKKAGRDPAWPVGANLALCWEKFGGLGKIRTETIGAAEEWYVAELLATSPKFQRKGLASLLLRYGLQKADKEKRMTYIEATPAGHPVYLKLGFKDIGIVEVDLSKYGGEGIGNNKIMVREPVAV